MNPHIDTLPVPGADQPADVGAQQQYSASSGQRMSEIDGQSDLTDLQKTTATATPGLAPVASAVEKDIDFERRWVITVKAIVARTKYDPYLQSNELSKAGREYRKELQGRS